MSEQVGTKAMFRAVSEPGCNVPVRWRIQRRTWYGWRDIKSAGVAISEADAQETVDRLQSTQHVIYPRVLT